MVLEFIGRDRFDRPVYQHAGVLYVDIDPRKNSKAKICKKSGNAFDGEPDYQISPDTEVSFFPERNTWGF